MLPAFQETITEYGCCLCQRSHLSTEPEYKAHLMHQSKHGVTVYQAGHVTAANRLERSLEAIARRKAGE